MVMDALASFVKCLQPFSCSMCKAEGKAMGIMYLLSKVLLKSTALVSPSICIAKFYHPFFFFADSDEFTLLGIIFRNLHKP